jgi:tetratricopeptide (TPR) repeat protein
MIFKKAVKSDTKRLSSLLPKSGNGLSQEELILEMADSYEKSGNKEKAIEHYELYLYKKNVEDPEILFKIGNLYGMEEYDKAVSYWQRAADKAYKPAIELIASLDHEE